MMTLRLTTNPVEPGPRSRIKEVQLCLFEHGFSDEDLPALTERCLTPADVEAEFECVVAAIRQKKAEAIAMLAWREKGRTSR